MLQISNFVGILTGILPTYIVVSTNQKQLLPLYFLYGPRVQTKIRALGVLPPVWFLFCCWCQGSCFDSWGSLIEALNFWDFYIEFFEELLNGKKKGYFLVLFININYKLKEDQNYLSVGQITNTDYLIPGQCYTGPNKVWSKAQTNSIQCSDTWSQRTDKAGINTVSHVLAKYNIFVSRERQQYKRKACKSIKPKDNTRQSSCKDHIQKMSTQQTNSGN